MSGSEELRQATHFEVVDCNVPPSPWGHATLMVCRQGLDQAKAGYQPFAVVKVVIHYTRTSPPVAKQVHKDVYVYTWSDKIAAEVAYALNRVEIDKARIEDCTGSDPGDDPDYAGA